MPIKKCCVSCGYESIDENRFKQSKIGIMCNICYTTIIGVAHQYPDQHLNVEVLKTLAAVANVVIDEVHELRKQVEDMK